MQLDREATLQALKIVKPALASRDQIEEFTCVWMDGKYMIATNDVGLGIHIPFQSEFKGGLKGSLLIDILHACKTREITIEQTDKEEMITLKSGRARFTLLVHKPSEMLGDIPDLKKLQFVQCSKNTMMALTKIMTGTGSDSEALPEKRGVTFIPDKKGVRVFSTDGATISTSTIKEGIVTKRFTLPSDFIKQALECEQPEMSTNSGGVAAARTEERLVFCKILDNPEPEDLAGLVDGALKNATFIPVPARLKLALARASVMLQKQEEKYLTLKIDGEVMRIRVESPLGELKDTLSLEKEHPKIEARFNPDLIVRGLKWCGQMAVTSKCMILKGDNFTQLIAPYSGKDKK